MQFQENIRKIRKKKWCLWVQADNPKKKTTTSNPSAWGAENGYHEVKHDKPCQTFPVANAFRRIGHVPSSPAIHYRPDCTVGSGRNCASFRRPKLSTEPSEPMA